MTQREVRFLRLTNEILEKEQPSSPIVLAQRVVQSFSVRHMYARPVSSEERCRIVASCTDAWLKHRARTMS